MRIIVAEVLCALFATLELPKNELQVEKLLVFREVTASLASDFICLIIHIGSLGVQRLRHRTF